MKDIELPPLPDPKYIYHDADDPGEADLYEFEFAGAVDGRCDICERLYTGDQLQAYARAAVEANSVPDVENMLLREMLAIRVAGAALYSDDGELQDNSAHPCIDFKRDPAHLIHYKLKARLSASPAPAPAPAQQKPDFLELMRDELLVMCPKKPAQQERKPMTDAASDVLAERQRQISAEGWTPEHDDEHAKGEMAAAAACYALHTEPVGNVGDYLRFWPWAAKWWKPADRRRNLVKAGALIVAEIERLDRAAERHHGIKE